MMSMKSIRQRKQVTTLFIESNNVLDEFTAPTLISQFAYVQNTFSRRAECINKLPEE